MTDFFHYGIIILLLLRGSIDNVTKSEINSSYAMGYKYLSNVYCHTHCVFYDYCKSNIKKCIIFRFEQILSDLDLQEFELEIFKMHFG